jgi:hypothetical protein
MDIVNEKHSLLVKQSPIDISNCEVVKLFNLFIEGMKEIQLKGAETAHYSPMWAQMTFDLINVGEDSHSITQTYLINKFVAEMYDLPVSMMYLFTMKMVIDPAQNVLHVVDEPVQFLDDDGYALPATHMAFHDLKELGLVDGEFIFEQDKSSKGIIESANEFLSMLQDSFGVSSDKALLMATGKYIDAPFPHENDDSLSEWI